MAKYNKDEVNAYLEECKSKGIQDPVCLYLIQRAMWTGFPENILHAISVPGLTEVQLMKLFGLVVNGFPEQEVIQLCQEPKKLQGCLERYYGELYRGDREKIYQEVFDSFQASWQQNFDQLLKQTDTLSDNLKFLQEQMEKKEQDLKEVREREKLLESKLQKLAVPEKGMADEVEQSDSVQAEKTIQTEPVQETETVKPVKKRKMWAFSRKRKKNALIAMTAQLNDEQFEEALDGYEKGLSVEEIRQYARPEISAAQMARMKELLLKMKSQEEKNEQK